MNTNINTVIANNANIICNASKKETNTMNAFAKIARRAAALFAFGGILLAAHSAAHADVTFEAITGPQDAYNQPSTGNAVAPGTTALQIKVHNTDTHYGVTGVNIQTYIYKDTDVNNGWVWRANPTSGLFNLGPDERRWVTIVIPTNDRFGQSLRGRKLYAKAIMGNYTTWLNNFLNSSFNIDIQVTSQMTNSDGSVSVTVQFKNIGHIASLSQQVALTYMPYADGNSWTSPRTTAAQTLPGINPGYSQSLTFRTVPVTYLGYSYINGTIQIGNEETLTLRF